MPKISIVVPFLNEAENITELYDRLKATLEAMGEPFEFIFVDDGSTDGTFNLLEEIATIDSRVIVVKLRRNFGKTAALAAGFERATGDFVVAMDGDLQQDPADIPRFVARLEDGYDVVCGWRQRRTDSFWLRRLPSKFANVLLATLSGVKIHDFAAGFKAYRRELINQIPLYGEMQGFIPLLSATYGARICEVPVAVARRAHGKSHYGLGRTVPAAFDLIAICFLHRYVMRPLHFFGTWGFVSIFAGAVIGLWLFIQKLVFGTEIMTAHAPLWIFCAVLVVFGGEMLAIGLLGEMQVRHYHEPPARPPYTIEKVLRTEESEQPSLPD